MANDICREPIIVSFRNERLRMTTPWPSHIYDIYGEEILRRIWWLHAILGVIWGWNVVVGGWVIFGTVENEKGNTHHLS